MALFEYKQKVQKVLFVIIVSIISNINKKSFVNTIMFIFNEFINNCNYS